MNDPLFSRSLQRAVASIVRAIFPSIDFLGFYEATVVSQNGDKSLELNTDDTRFASLSNVPIAWGDAGVTATIAPSSRVLLFFAGGDRSKPRAGLFPSSTVLELDLNATLIKLNGGSLPVARLTDNVVGTAGPYPVAATITAPGNPTVLA